jgi:hypothetical protein
MAIVAAAEHANTTAMVVRGFWLTLLAATRAVEHLVIGGVFGAILMNQVSGRGLDLEPLIRALMHLL